MISSKLSNFFRHINNLKKIQQIYENLNNISNSKQKIKMKKENPEKLIRPHQKNILFLFNKLVFIKKINDIVLILLFKDIGIQPEVLSQTPFRIQGGGHYTQRTQDTKHRTILCLI